MTLKVPGLGRPMTNEEAIALLLELGDTEAEVAANLKLLGHRGRRRKGCRCPVARYLQAHGAPCIAITLRRAHPTGLVDGAAFQPGPRLPPPVSKFVYAFDRGGYPELELAG